MFEDLDDSDGVNWSWESPDLAGAEIVLPFAHLKSTDGAFEFKIDPYSMRLLRDDASFLGFGGGGAGKLTPGVAFHERAWTVQIHAPPI
jgi:hypothetical protein